MKVTRKDVRAIVDATFPEYQGRKFRVTPLPNNSLTLHNLNWDGGTRSVYRACTLAGELTGGSERYNAMAPWDKGQIEGHSLPVPNGFVVVEHSMFCGKDMGLTIFVPVSNMLDIGIQKSVRSIESQI